MGCCQLLSSYHAFDCMQATERSRLIVLQRQTHTDADRLICWNEMLSFTDSELCVVHLIKVYFQDQILSTITLREKLLA